MNSGRKEVQRKGKERLGGGGGGGGREERKGETERRKQTDRHGD